MELLVKTGAVKLRSHLDKYLVADEDSDTVRQSRNGSTRRAIWVIEPCPKNPDAIGLKNLATSLYLTASDTPFLLGMTGKRVVQLSIFDPTRVVWEPIRDGFQVKFRCAKEGTYLRANGGTPPWRNSMTHDVPLTGGTYNWVLWDVDPVDLGSGFRSSFKGPSPVSSFNSDPSDEFLGSSPASPLPGMSNLAPKLTGIKSGMDLFTNAKAVRLRSHHDKYLLAEEDEESVTQDRNGSSKKARWTVEFAGIDGVSTTVIRLKSCYGKYLTASNQPFLLGMTGRKVLQTLPRRLDSSVEWEPVREGSQVKLKTRYCHFLRANGGVPPWRNSVTHDVPHRTATQDWVLWNVEILEIVEHDTPLNYGSQKEVAEAAVKQQQPPAKVEPVVAHVDSLSSGSSSPSVRSKRFHKYARQESSDSAKYSPPKPDGRLIYYHIADDRGDIDASVEGYSFAFKGNSVEELSQKLLEETGLEDIVVCTRNPVNGKLFPLRLQLPPNNATMHVIIVPSSSRVTRDLEKLGIS